MKRQSLSLLALLVYIASMAQTIGEAFYVYRSDGMINTFFRSEVDSMTYSCYDTDSIYYDEPVTQVIYTPDSIYRIPLAMVDSVGFVTPETRYQPGVVRLEGTIRDYIIGSDSLTVFFRSDTPLGILPRIGEKLVTTEMSDVFKGGFLGQIERIELNSDVIICHCSAIGIEDVYECFYYSVDNNPQNNSSKAKAKEEWDYHYNPEPYVYSFTSFLEASCQPFNCPVKFTPKFEGSITNAFHSKGSIIVHPLRGTVISMDIKHQTSLVTDLVLSGEVDKSHDFTPHEFPLCMPLPFVWIYVEGGAFVRANCKVALEGHWNQNLDFGIHYEATHLPGIIIPVLPKFNLTKLDLKTEHDSKFMIDGYVAGGFYGELGVELLSKKILSAGFRLEAGMKFGGNAILYDTDGESVLNYASDYERLKAGELYIKPFCKAGLQAQCLKFGKGEINLFEKDWDLGKYKLVPNFSNTTLKRVKDTPSTLITASTASGSTIVPVTLGFKLFEEEEQDGINGENPISYWNRYGYPELYFDTIPNQSLIKSYTAYPIVSLFGKEYLATPKAKIEAGIKPMTLVVTNITETSAIAQGKIVGHELMDETISFGLAYQEIGSMITHVYPATTMNSDGHFFVEFRDLKVDTEYRFFAYLESGGERVTGIKRLFKTDVHREPYYVWNRDSANTKTFYYDEKRISRGGRLFSTQDEHSVAYVQDPWVHPYVSSPIKVVFDASFYKYHPKYFSFKYCDKLERIENLKYLNTDEITNMNGMFQDCSLLTSLDLSNFNTTQVTDMTNMFLNCSSLTSLDLYTFDTSKVRSMREMFQNCDSLTGLDLSNINTSNVTDMLLMFCGCKSLMYLDVSNFNTEKVTNMSHMFDGCCSLMDLNLQSFDTANVTDMSWMFCNCSSLTSLNLSNFKTPSVKHMGRMFNNCNSLTVLDLSNFHVNQSSMDTFEFGSQGYNSFIFEKCSSLRTIYAKNWNIRLDRWTFLDCSNLVGGMGTKIGDNFYGLDKDGRPLYYYCSDGGEAARVDGGKDSPGLFTGM